MPEGSKAMQITGPVCCFQKVGTAVSLSGNNDSLS